MSASLMHSATSVTRTARSRTARLNWITCEDSATRGTYEPLCWMSTSASERLSTRPQVRGNRYRQHRPNLHHLSNSPNLDHDPPEKKCFQVWIPPRLS